MPIQKVGRKRDPLWKEWDRLAQKEGERKTVYAVGGDEYTGEWKENMKHGDLDVHGKGVQVWKKSGSRYDGDWCEGKRHGFGMYSVLRDEQQMKEYSGGWKNDKRHGYGTRYYSPDEYYEGEWYANERCGWGRMYYKDGSVYEGEWFEDKRNGKGLLKLANGNRYEGSWKDDKKHGTGKFLYLDKGQVYTGYWIEGTAKNGSIEDFGRNEASNAPLFMIPECKLHNSKQVIEQVVTDLESSTLK